MVSQAVIHLLYHNVCHSSFLAQAYIPTHQEVTRPCSPGIRVPLNAWLHQYYVMEENTARKPKTPTQRSHLVGPEAQACAMFRFWLKQPSH